MKQLGLFDTSEEPVYTLNYLVVARHGKYESYHKDRILNEEGRNDMRILADSIQGVIGNSNHIQILSSSANRGRESAEELSSRLNINNVETFDFLWSGKDSPWQEKFGDLPKVHELVSNRRNKARGLIIVTHLEVSKEYPGYFNTKEFGNNKYYFDEIKKGEAYILDIEKGIWKILPSGVIVNNVKNKN